MRLHLFSRALRGPFVYATIILVTLGVCEVALRIRDPRSLSMAIDGNGILNLAYRYDSELGWIPRPNSAGTFTATRTVATRHNSLGLRDREPETSAATTILFLGDSFVWGYDVEAKERFTDILQRGLPRVGIINAGVAGYGTDQEYLFIRRLWDRTKPNVVVLVFCVNNDHLDNSTNKRYDTYKPYYAQASGGSHEFRGIPVPYSKRYIFSNYWATRNSLIARLVTTLYLSVAHPEVHAPDPTAKLILMIRKFVEVRGAKFFMGLQDRDAALEAFLNAQGIKYVSFAGADHYPSHGEHWTPEGHALVANRLMAFLAANGVLPSDILGGRSHSSQ